MKINVPSVKTASTNWAHSTGLRNWFKNKKNKKWSGNSRLKTDGTAESVDLISVSEASRKKKKESSLKLSFVSFNFYKSQEANSVLRESSCKFWPPFPLTGHNSAKSQWFVSLSHSSSKKKIEVFRILQAGQSVSMNSSDTDLVLRTLVITLECGSQCCVVFCSDMKHRKQTSESRCSNYRHWTIKRC